MSIRFLSLQAIAALHFLSINHLFIFKTSKAIEGAHSTNVLNTSSSNAVQMQWILEKLLLDNHVEALHSNFKPITFHMSLSIFTSQWMLETHSKQAINFYFYMTERYSILYSSMMHKISAHHILQLSLLQQLKDLY